MFVSAFSYSFVHFQRPIFNPFHLSHLSNNSQKFLLASGERAGSQGKDPVKEERKRSPRDSRSRSRDRRSRSPEKQDTEGTVLYVGNLSRRVDEADIRDAFEKFGRIADINIIKDPYTNECRGFAFVRYESSNDATDALELDNKEISGRKIRVEKSKRNQGHQKTPGEYLGPDRRRSGGHGRSRRSPSPYDRRRSPRRSRDRSPRDRHRDRYRSHGGRDRRRSGSRDRSGSYSRRRR